MRKKGKRKHFYHVWLEIGRKGKGKGKEKYHSFPLQKEGKWEQKKCISTKS